MSDTTFACPADLNRDTGTALIHEVRKARIPSGANVVLDLSKTRKMDSLGGACLVAIADHVRARRGELRLEGKQAEVADYLEIVEPVIRPTQVKKRRHETALEVVGGQAIAVAKELRQFGILCIEAIYWTILAPFEGRGFRFGALVDELFEMGVRAILICVTMNYLLGLIIAMLFAKQAEKYGLQLWVADGLMQGFARELAAIMTAIIVSARTGAAIAAELSTMKVQEEVDALRGMGLNVTQFIVAPKLLALVIVMPCLVMLGLFAGLAGGTTWGVFALGFPFPVWLQQTLNAARFNEVFQGLFKSLFFAIGIALIGCHNGLRVSGGSRGVGLMTTRAVVMDIFMIICVDIIFATMFYYVLV